MSVFRIRMIPFILAFNLLVLSVYHLTVEAQTDLNCDDFVSQAAAQAVLDLDASDPNKLDGNRNGEACESFPYQQVNQTAAVTVVLTDDDITRIADQIVAGVLAGLETDEATSVDDATPEPATPVDPVDEAIPGVDDADSGPTPEPDVPNLGITDDGYSVLALTALATYLDSLDN